MLHPLTKLVDTEFDGLHIMHFRVQISIQNHTLKVIAADGNLVEPFDVESINLYAGHLFVFFHIYLRSVLVI